MVYESLKDVRVLDDGDVMTAETLLPGFKLSLREFFSL